MLQRAASNAYFWWWASHIRTKQSKWLEQNLIDVEDKMQSMMKIIQQEGDSFARRAEMYYKLRPELINYVEECYRAYRALAERFDVLSKDLQNANRTIATVFPEQVQLSMESDDDDSQLGSMSPSSEHSEKSFRSTPVAAKNLPKAPKLPKPPTQTLKSLSVIASKRDQLRKKMNSQPIPTNTSGLSKEEAFKEIDAIQKEILGLQTEKEFVRSSYESSLAKFYETEERISELQGKVCILQDEFGFGTVIENHDARSIMSATALRSCAEALNKLREEQEKAAEEANIEYQRIKEAHQKLEDLKKVHKISYEGGEALEQDELRPKSIEEIMGNADLEGLNMESLRQKIKEQLKLDSSSALTEPELAENIDELVEKIVRLQTALCSQNSLVKRLRQHIDELLKQIKVLAENKEDIAQDEEKSRRILELEEELIRVNALNKDLVEQRETLNAEIVEANCNLDDLNEKIKDVRPADETDEAEDPCGSKKEIEPEPEMEERETEPGSSDVVSESHMEEDDMEKQSESQTAESTAKADLQELRPEEEEGINWRQLYLNNIEERERILVQEYTMILRDYKDIKTKMSEAEKKSRNDIFELASHARELRTTIALKDEEIQKLRRQLQGYLNSEESEAQLEKKMHRRTPSQPESNRQPLFHHLHDPTIGIIAIHESNENRGSSGALTRPISTVEARLRAELNNLLEGNIDFWLRFSTSFHQIQKFQNTIKDLQSELAKLREEKMSGMSQELNLKSDARPLYKHLREIQTEMTLWLEHSAVFQGELKSRFSALDNIQDEITKILHKGGKKKGVEPELSNYQAVKFQGEVLNMKQENSKVAEELQAGIYRVTGLQEEIDKVMIKMDKEFKLSESKSLISKPRLPLQSFLFGVKLRRKPKHRQSLLACVGPAFYKHYSDLPNS